MRGGGVGRASDEGDALCMTGEGDRASERLSGGILNELTVGEFGLLESRGREGRDSNEGRGGAV